MSRGARVVEYVLVAGLVPKKGGSSPRVQDSKRNFSPCFDSDRCGRVFVLYALGNGKENVCMFVLGQWLMYVAWGAGSCLSCRQTDLRVLNVLSLTAYRIIPGDVGEQLQLNGRSL